ncbi:hypothetical protein B9L23_08075 [Parageobacillus galactosidasius]|uniref:Uncharacterized protein n=1 Tax=Parageobacillus galactosidasius TaxID=883812 RepID=A0A226QTS0_9BACL|nr:hypothetical protein B9L23_08075 [Parageobacillus galactosidasius]
MRSLVVYTTLILKGWFKHPLSLAICIALGIPLIYFLNIFNAPSAFAIHLPPKEVGVFLLIYDKK